MLTQVIDLCRIILKPSAHVTRHIVGINHTIERESQYFGHTLITTHYSGLGVQCRRLRVKGFVEGMADVPITPQNINLFIDYSLDEDQNDNVPQEALRIADILGCDREMTTLARENINK